MKPKVKETEKSRILSTKDYSLFEFPDGNINDKNLEFIKSSILDKNLLPDYPILVDDGYHILDGKYKFLACYELKLPIYYKVAEVTTKEDAIRIKEINFKTPLAQIIDAYKHLESYGALIFIKEHFNNDYKYVDILRFIESANKKRAKDSTIGVLDRYKLASGKLNDIDPTVIINRIVKAKYIVEEFAWDFVSAAQILKYFDYDVDYRKHSSELRLAKKVSDGLRSEKWTKNVPGNSCFGAFTTMLRKADRDYLVGEYA